jgi:hypothetical protein
LRVRALIWLSTLRRWQAELRVAGSQMTRAAWLVCQCRVPVF